MPVTANPSPAAGGERPGALPSIGSFVTPFPDETPFSILSRYYVLYTPRAATSLSADFFGWNNRKITGAFPGGLDRFYRAAPPGLWRDLGDFLERHTLLPYHRPFLGSRAAKKLAALPSRFELTPKDVLGADELVAPRFCPACVREDLERLGQPYWRRTHQVSGVLVCHEHEIGLLNHCPACDTLAGYGAHLFLPKFECECGYTLAAMVFGNHPFDKLRSSSLDVARFSAGLLDARIPPVGAPALAALCRDALRDRGYCRGSYLEKSRLWRDFCRHHTPDFIEAVGLSAPAGTHPRWFTEAVTPLFGRTLRPLYQILLLSFVFPDFASFRKAIGDLGPEGAWEKAVERNLRGTKDGARRRVSSSRNAWKLNLEARDTEAESKLRIVTEQLRNSPVRPVRLTKRSLLKYANLHCRVPGYLEHLPKTRQALEDFVDTAESFNQRKIAWALRKLSKSGIPATKMAVLRTASIRPEFYYLIDEALATALGA